jgi:DNA mismatch endonuclease (patch repair protein)
MTDIVDSSTRSRMMAGIQGKDTTPEMQIRRGLHALGFRFRLHDRKLPGRPDLVLPGYRAVIFVHGCFWHHHPGCHYATMPATRPDFWQKKFRENRERDARNRQKLEEQGWRVFTVWECGLKHDPEGVLEVLAEALREEEVRVLEIPGKPLKPAKKN